MGHALSYEDLERKVHELEKEAFTRKQADEILRNSEERYRMIFKYSPLGIVHLDCDGLVIDCNERFLEIVGAPKGGLIGFNMRESFPDEKMRAAVTACLSGEPGSFEGDCPSVSGNRLSSVRAIYSRVTSEEGKFLGAMGLWEDITERKHLEEYLWRIANSTSDPIYVVDKQHRYVLANDALCALAGRKREDILGKTDYDFFPKEQVDIFWEKDELVFETGEENENEEEITDGNGITCTVVTKKTLYTDRHGNKFIVGIIRDITHRKEAELALQAAYQEIQDIIEFLPDATLVIDREKRVKYWNRAMEEMTGVEKKDILGKSDNAYAVPFYGEKGPMLIDHVMAEVPEIESRYDSFKRMGKKIYGEGFVPGAYRGKGAYLCSTAAPLIGRDGSTIGSIQSIRDISDRKLAEDLGKTSVYTRNLIEASPDPLVTISPEGKITDVNKATELVTGFSRDYLIGSDFSDYFTEPERARQGYRKVISQGYIKDYPLTIRHTSGRLTDVLYNAVVYMSESGVMQGVFAAARDISERKRAERALRESQQMLQSVLDTIPVRVFWKNLDLNYLGCNRPFALDAGLQSPEDIVGKNDFEMGWTEQAELYRSDDRLVIETGTSKLGYEEPQTTPDGNRIWLRTNKVPLLDAKGRIKGILGTYEDITKSKQMEDMLEASETKYRIVADNTYDWEDWLSPDGHFLYASPSCERITGYASSEFETNPKLLPHIIHPDDLAPFEAHLEWDRIRSGPFGLEFRIIHRDGTTRWIGHLCQPVFDAEGLFLGRRGSNRDITDRKQAEKALQDASENLKFFAYSVAHDLKSPAIGIYGLTKRLQKQYKDVLDEKGRNYCEQILKVSEHIAALVEKINIYIATKEARLSFEKITLKEILGMLMDEFSVKFNIRRITWIVPGSDVEVTADRLSLLRAFRNLIDNALKYGGEQLSKICVGHEEKGGYHVFSITDNGKGLKGGDPKKIFGLFQRQETSMGVEGAGLGLAIVKEIAEKHGGEAWVEQTAKSETTFFLSLSKNLPSS